MIPGSANPLLLKSAAAAGALQIERSLRFNSSDSAYLYRTPAVAGTRTTWTWSGWLKRSKSATQFLFGSVNAATQQRFGFISDKLYWVWAQGTAARETAAVFRDFSAWYHIQLVSDTGNATPANRILIYVNGVSQSLSGDTVSPGEQWDINTTIQHAIGAFSDAGPFGSFLDGYLANIHFIDGQALTPSSFTEPDATTGQLIPKTYTGSYGTNGFNLLFADNSSNTASTLGKDTSGLSNNWTPVNLSVSTTGPIYSSTFTYSGTGSPAGVQDAAGAFLANSPTIPDSSQSSGRNAYVNHSGGTSFIQFNPSPAISGSNVRVFTYQPQGTSGADTWINVNGGSDLRPWRVPANYTGWSNSVAIPGGSLSSLRVSLSYGGGSSVPFYAVEVDGVVLREHAPAQDIDSLVDSPTNYGTDTYVGGEVRGNYATLNPLKNNSNNVLSNGNLTIVNSASSTSLSFATIALPKSGKYYFEGLASANAGSTNVQIGIFSTDHALTQTGSKRYWYLESGPILDDNTTLQTVNTYGNGDLIGVAYNADANTVTWYKNGTQQGTAVSVSTSYDYVFGTGIYKGQWDVNFGQRAFAHPVSGFKALCTQNLPAPLVTKSNTVFDVVTYTGNGSTQTISGLGFSPDLVWLKVRSNAVGHGLFDQVRGAGKALYSHATNAEYDYGTTSSGELYQFNSDGFNLGSFGVWNVNNQTSVAWAWDAGTSTVSNPDGSIPSQVRANPTAGFSVVTYTGPGPSSNTVGHGLGVAPELIITKNRDRSIYWIVYTKTTGKDAFLRLNTTDASAASGSIWGTAVPTSTVFGGVGTDNSNGYTAGEKIVSYCFAPVVGYSSFGSYTGNGSTDGPFVYTGMRPRWVLVKASSSVSYGSWRLHDTARDPYNVCGNQLIPNLSDSEYGPGSVGTVMDILSNGFKLRSSFDGWNGSGATYIYAAFAESPFNYSRAR